jgi:hypothetical protein
MRNLSTAALSILLALAAGALAPAQASTPRLDLGVCSGTAGQRACVPVTLTANGGSVASAGFTVQYDTTTMRLPGGASDVHGGAALTGGQTVIAKVDEDINTTSGRVQVVIMPPPQASVPVIGDGALCEICFTVPAGAACTAPSFAPGSVDLGDATGRDVPVVAVSASGSAVGGCEINSTLASAECRLAALIAATEGRGDLSTFKGGLLKRLGRARSKIDAAQQLGTAGKSRAAQNAVQRAIRVLENVERRLQSRTANRRVAASARAALLNAVGAIRGALSQAATVA